MAVDDDVIMESPYGAVVSMDSFSPRFDFSKQNNLTLVVMEGDRGTRRGWGLLLYHQII